MATPVYPPGVQVRGSVKLIAVPTIADPNAPKLATEVNAASALDISCMVGAAGWKPSLNQSKGNAPRRACSKAERQVLGFAMYELQDLLYSTNPQSATGGDGVKAQEKLVPGTTINIVERLGVDISTDLAVGQWVNIWPVTLGEQVEDYDLADEFGEYLVRQTLVMAGSGVPFRRKQLVA